MVYSYMRTGNRHLERQKPCEDSVATTEFGNFSFLVLCDGCSSSKYSCESAYRMSLHLATFMRFPKVFIINMPDTDNHGFAKYCSTEGNEETFMRLLLREANYESEALSHLFQCKRSDLCCTLIAALVEYHPDTDSNTAIVITVGDGFVAAFNKNDKETNLVSFGENRNNNPNMTYFCTSEDAVEHAQVYRLTNVDSILLSSDGLTHVVNIRQSDELAGFLSGVNEIVSEPSSALDEAMDHLLSTYSCTRGRDLNDDCSMIFYSTEKQSAGRIAKNNKHKHRR